MHPTHSLACRPSRLRKVAVTLARPALGKSSLHSMRHNQQLHDYDGCAATAPAKRELDAHSCFIVHQEAELKLCWETASADLKCTCCGKPGPPIAHGTGFSVWLVSCTGLPSISTGTPDLSLCMGTQAARAHA